MDIIITPFQSDNENLDPSRLVRLNLSIILRQTVPFIANLHVQLGNLGMHQKCFDLRNHTRRRETNRKINVDMETLRIISPMVNAGLTRLTDHKEPINVSSMLFCISQCVSSQPMSKVMLRPSKNRRGASARVNWSKKFQDDK